MFAECGMRVYEAMGTVPWVTEEGNGRNAMRAIGYGKALSRYNGYIRHLN